MKTTCVHVLHEKKSLAGSSIGTITSPYFLGPGMKSQCGTYRDTNTCQLYAILVDADADI